MKRIYDATHLPDAYIVRDLLTHAGIAAHVFNENAVTSLGLVPVPSTCPQVWIAQPHQETHARAIIDEFLNRATSSQLFVCANCGEENPPAFDYCWQCQTARPAPSVGRA